MQPGQMAYDRAITVFSPDGRLFQVEYARVAVTRGNTTVGLKFKNGIVLLADKKIGSRLVETSSIEKIFQIDEHVGAATSGLVADARVLVDYARLVAQINKVTYSERIGVDLLVKRICDYKQNYTQSGGGRDAVMEICEEKYKDGIEKDDAVILGLEALQKASEGEKLDARAIEVGVVVEGEKFRRLSAAGGSEYLSRIPAAA